MGFNRILLNQPVQVSRGNSLLLTQSGGVVAIDESASSIYSDLVYQGGYWINLSYTVNKRLLLNPLTNFSSYYANLTLSHTYTNNGDYNLNITLANSKQTFIQPVAIYNGKFIFF